MRLGALLALLAASVLLAPAAFGQADARESEYYSWCRSQGGTPEGSLSTLHCVPPESGGSADGAVIPAGPRNMQEAISLGVMKGLTNVAVQAMQNAARRPAPRPMPTYDQWRNGENGSGDGEGALRRQQERQKAQAAAEQKDISNMLVMPEDAPAPSPPPAPRAAPASDGGVRLNTTAGAPALLTGDPAPVCKAAAPSARRSLQCLESDSIDVPPPPFLAKEDEAKARAFEKQLADELDARRHDGAQYSQLDLEDQAGQYLRKQAEDEYAEKGKGYLLGEKEGGRPMGVVESVKEAGKITSNYAKETLAAFQGESASAACILGSRAPNSCWDDYHEHARKVESGAEDLDRETRVFVAKSYGAEKGWSSFKHHALGGDGAELFFEAFR